MQVLEPRDRAALALRPGDVMTSERLANALMAVSVRFAIGYRPNVRRGGVAAIGQLTPCGVST